ncbi:MAG: hypothetical protein K5912_00975 [Alphaproteobacteria bacterium]|nr:hypothetical protein [Alphaproteobacteria bacterium]
MKHPAEIRRNNRMPGGLISRICTPAVMLVVGMVGSFDAFGAIGNYSKTGYSSGYTNPTINQLIAEKQRKVEQLEKCSKKVKGFKIAGISTIGLTTAGIAGNIVLSKKKETVAGQLSTARDKLAAKKKADAARNNISTNNAGTSREEENDGYATGTGVYVKDLDDGDFYGEGTYDVCNNSLNNNGDWCTTDFEYYVKGVSACLGEYSYGNEEKFNVAENQNIIAGTNNGQYCYCKLTGVKGSQLEEDRAWVFDKTHENCGDNCAFMCGADVLEVSSFMDALETKVSDLSSDNEDENETVVGFKEMFNERVGKIAKVFDGFVYGDDTTVNQCNVSRDGDWCAQFKDYTVNGVSACVDDNVYANENDNELAVNQDSITEYDHGSGTSEENTGKRHCYYKVKSCTQISTGDKDICSESKWIFDKSYPSEKSCNTLCTNHGAYMFYGNFDNVIEKMGF